MRIRSICSILLIALIILTTTVTAYTTDTFSITVNENYEQTTDKGLVMFQNVETGDNIVVQEIEQKVIGGKLSTYQLNAISEEITSQYKEIYDADVEQLGKEDVTINGRNVTKMKFKTSLEGVEIYQELNIFVSSDKIYDIIFTSMSENGFTQEEKDAVLNSFNIVEENKATDETNNETSTAGLEKAWIEMGVILVIAIILIVIAIKRNPSSKMYILSIVFLALQVLAIKGIEMEEGTTKSITEDVAYNIGFFIFAIIGMILIIIQIAKKPKKVETKKENEIEIEEKAKEIIKSEENKNEIVEDKKEEKQQEEQNGEETK